MTENPFELKNPEIAKQVEGKLEGFVVKTKKIEVGNNQDFADFLTGSKKVDESKSSKWNLLSLDIATSTGWCTRTASGTWNFTLKKDESKGMRLIRFNAKLREICELEKINLIVFEQLATYGKFPNFVAAEMQGVLKLFCTQNNIEHRSYAPTEIKKFATGSGGAKKEKMVLAAKKYKPEVSSDDEADAILLYHLAMKDLLI